MAHIRQSRPDSGLGFQVKVLKIFQVVPSSLGSAKSTSPDTPTPATPRKTLREVIPGGGFVIWGRFWQPF
jgi:hypothetical protein